MRILRACAVPFAFGLSCITPPSADAGLLTYDSKAALAACDNGYRSISVGGSTVGARVFNGVCQIIAEPLPDIVNPAAMLSSAVLDELDGFKARNAAQGTQAGLTDDILPQPPVIIDGLRLAATSPRETQQSGDVPLAAILAAVSILSLVTLLVTQRGRLGSLWRRDSP